MIDSLTTSLKGKNALICGSTAGMGKAVSKEFAQMGANVTLFSRNEEKLKLVIESMDCLNNQNHRFLVGDFNHPDNIQSVINNDISQGNTYHILINNSGGPEGGPIIEAKKSEFIEGFNRHLICNHILSTALLSGMKSQKYGRIINIISTSVKQPIQGLGVSNTIRGAVASWSKTFSFEVSKWGITVNNILPGFTDTGRLSSLIESKAKSSNLTETEITNEMKNKIPAGRFGTPEETAKAIAFLASPAAGYINGVNLAVDGGRLSCI